MKNITDSEIKVEAFELIAKLNAIKDRLSRSDRLFLDGLKRYVIREGANIQIGKYRLKALRETAHTYGITASVPIELSFNDEVISQAPVNTFAAIPYQKRRSILRKQMNIET